MHAAMLVELASLRVSLEDPEPKALRRELRDALEEEAAETPTVELRVDVEVVGRLSLSLKNPATRSSSSATQTSSCWGKISRIHDNTSSEL